MEQNALVAQIKTEQFNLTEHPSLSRLIDRLLDEGNEDGLAELLLDLAAEDEPEPDSYELTTEIAVREEDGRLVFSYDESAVSGMEGTKTEISFAKNDRGLLFISRYGSVKTTFVLEKGVRHTCTYQTPYMPFEMIVLTRSAVNTLTEKGGRLLLDYFIEIRGAAVQHVKLTVNVRECR